MTFHWYLSKAVQDDAQLAAERDRLILMARRADTARGERAGLAAPVRRRLTRLLFRRASPYVLYLSVVLVGARSWRVDVGSRLAKPSRNDARRAT